MPVVNNKEGVPLSHYVALYEKLDAEEVTLRTGCAYNDGAFEIGVFARRVYAQFPEFKLSSEPETMRALTNDAASILFLRWLIEGKRAPFNGRFLSYREVPWGEVYDSNFDGRCRRRLAGTFGRDLAWFRRSCEKLGGTEVNTGDAAYDLPLPGGNTLRLILREGDDEFPATSQILFSDNITEAWSAEDLAVLGEVTIRALTEVK